MHSVSHRNVWEFVKTLIAESSTDIVAEKVTG